MAGKPVVGYWDIHGLGESIRLMLTYAGVDFVDKRYTIAGAGPNYDLTNWISEKYNLGLDFPNLPYYIDDEVRMTQSLAILQHLGRKHQLTGKDEAEMIRISMMEQQVVDLFMAMARLAYNPDYEKMMGEYLQQLPDKLTLMNRYLDNNDYVAGNHLTYVDFYVYVYLQFLKVMVPEVYAKYPALIAYHDRIESLPNVNDYLKKQSPKFCFGPMAKWNRTY